MKVECIKIINPNTGVEENKLISGYLEVGKQYLVLEIYVLMHEKEISLRIDNETTVPLSADAKQFKTICNKIPSNWVSIYEDGNLYIGPDKWLDNSLWEFSFWEDYLSDTCPEAERVFEEERQKIRDEVG